MGKRPLFYAPITWLPRAIKRARRVLPHTKVYPSEADTSFCCTTKRYHERTIQQLHELKEIDPNGPDWPLWIIAGVRLEGTCEALGIAEKEGGDA